MMTGTPELLPCPFCGAMPHSHADNIRHNPDDLPWNGQWIIECNACPVDSSTWAPTKDKAVEQWNTRVPPSTVGESGAALAALLAWCQIERGKLVVDGYDYKSGEEFGIRRVELQIERAIRSIASEKEGGTGDLAKVQATADEVVSRIVEWDDRTSPEDFPEALLITPSELHRELVRFATDIGALASGEKK